ncbi:MAG: cation transporter [Clostridia bacterium]|nr:cation transporter [Clostridia bacterium]
MLTNLLIKTFVKNKNDVQSPTVRSAYATLSSVTGIVLNLLLFVGKLVTGILAASVAIIADAFNNVTDAGSSVVTMLGFRLAAKPVDKEHPLGHGRFEYVSGFIVDMVIVLVGVELLTTSIEKIITPTLPAVGNITLILLGVAILVKLWLFFFYSKIGKTISSSAIKAAAMDSLTDCAATTLVLISALVSRYFSVPMDGWAGIVVAGFILFAGIRATKETIDLLLGTPPSPDFIQSIHDFVKRYEEIVGIHDLMVHDYGPGRQIVSFHAEVPESCDINHAHEVIDNAEREMHARFGCIVTIHLDPITVGNEEVDKMRALAERLAREVDPDFSIHDFRMTKGDLNVNMIFDLVIPAGHKLPLAEAAKAVSDKISAENEHYHAVIHAEHPFV